MTINCKNIKGLLWAQLIGLLVFFQFLPNLYDDYSMSSSGSSFGWSKALMIRPYGDSWGMMNNDLVNNPQGSWEFTQILNVLINLLVVAIILFIGRFLLKNLHKKGLLNWSKNQLRINVSAFLLILTLNFYFTVFHHRDYEALTARTSSTAIFLSGWPVPQGIAQPPPPPGELSRENYVYLHGLHALNLPLAFLLPLILALLCKAKKEDA